MSRSFRAGPFVLPFVAVVVGAALFAGVAHNVTGHDGVARADPRLLHDVIAFRSSGLTVLAKIVTTLGTSPFAYGTIVLCGIVPATRHRRWSHVGLAAAVLLSGQLVRLAINVGIARPRPPQHLWLMRAAGHAFPSGHTTTATLGYLLAALLLTQQWPRFGAAIFGLAALGSVAVGLSRVYLGVHWPTDVLGGWLFALTWLALWALGWQTAEHIRRR